MKKYSKIGNRAGLSAYRTTSEFMERVLLVVRRIPKGKTLSYKSVAEKAGSPKAYRAVGSLMAKNGNPRIPCHRVINSDGTPGGYNKGRRRKVGLLEKEGVVFDNNGKVRL